ncbi:MAG: regulatory protein GemA [Pseudomonadota bacterium]
MTANLKRLIHVGCRELGIDQDARKALQLAVVGKPSMSDMNEDELKSVLQRLKDDGFKPQAQSGKRHAKAGRADLRFVHVLWRELGKAKAVDGTRKGLNAFIRARFGTAWGSVPADFDMLTRADQINDVIQALKAICDRKGVQLDWEAQDR